PRPSVVCLASLCLQRSSSTASAVIRPTHCSTLFPYTTLFRSRPLPGRGEPVHRHPAEQGHRLRGCGEDRQARRGQQDDGHLVGRSEEHTSELQSRFDLVCRLLLEKKNTNLTKRQLAAIDYAIA